MRAAKRAVGLSKRHSHPIFSPKWKYLTGAPRIPEPLSSSMFNSESQHLWIPLGEIRAGQKQLGSTQLGTDHAPSVHVCGLLK